MTVKALGAALVLAAIAAAVAGSAPPSSAATKVAKVAGEYEGDFDGAGAAVTISGAAPRYTVHIIVGGDGCAGGALGPARADRRGVLTVRPTDDAKCTITMTPVARGYSLAEAGCGNLHGDTCGFEGVVHRKR